MSTAPSHASRLLLFVRAAAPDYLLVLATSFGVMYALYSGFDATLDLRSQVPLMVAVPALLLLLLFTGAWSKRAVLVSAALTALVSVGVVIVAIFVSPSSVPFIADGAVNDEAGNYAIFALIAVLVPIIVYLLSRRRVGCVVLLVLATLICCGVQFLFRDWMSSEGGLPAFLFSFVGALALLVYQQFRQNVYRAKLAQSPAFGAAFLFSLAAVGLSVACAVGAFFGLVQPLNLETPVIKPFEMHILRPVIEYTGVYDVLQVENPNIRSSLVGEEETDTNEPYDGGEVPQDEQQGQSNSNPLVQFVQSLNIFDENNWNEDTNPVTYNQLRTTFLWVIAGLLLAVMAAVAARLWWRRRRLQKLAALSPAQRVSALYKFLRSRFEKLGITATPSQTPLEFAFARHQDMEPWNRHTGKVNFLRITLMYQRAAYGTGDVSEAEYKQAERYYEEFFANTRRFVGTARWLWLFWKI